MVPEAGRAEEAQRAAGLKKLPLDGLMGEAGWNGVCLEMRTRGGVFWPIPVYIPPRINPDVPIYDTTAKPQGCRALMPQNLSRSPSPRDTARKAQKAPPRVRISGPTAFTSL